MSVIFHTVLSMILHLKRKCPECKREQIVPSSQREETADQPGHDAGVFAVFSGVDHG